MPSLVEIDPVVREKKISKFRQYIFAISNYLRLEKCVSLYLKKKLNLLHPRIFCAKFGRNWLSGSGEEGENVKCLRTDGRTEDGSKAIRKARLTFQLK